MVAVTVAAIQSASVAYDLQATLQKLERLVVEAKDAGAEFCVFPEAYLSAYPRHLEFAVGSRSDTSRDWYRRYHESSVLVPDQAFTEEAAAAGGVVTGDDRFAAWNALSRIARENGMHVSVGIIESSETGGGTLFCSNLLINSEGVLLSKHQKLQPTAAERIIWSQGQATYESKSSSTGKRDNLPVVQTSFGKVGGLICWENFMALARYAQYEKGVQIWTAPTADGRPTWPPTLQHIAQEGRMFVIGVNQFTTSASYPEDYPARIADNGANSVWCPGGTCIIDPLGRFLAGPLWGEEGILYAKVDVKDLIGAKLDFDPTGHYSRADIFDFKVKE